MDKFLTWDRWGLFNQNKHYCFKVFIAKEIPGVRKNFLSSVDKQSDFKPTIDLISLLNISKSLDDSDFILKDLFNNKDEFNKLIMKEFLRKNRISVVDELKFMENSIPNFQHFLKKKPKTII